jgi:hypothetical protein
MLIVAAHVTLPLTTLAYFDSLNNKQDFGKRYGSKFQNNKNI